MSNEQFYIYTWVHILTFIIMFVSSVEFKDEVRKQGNSWLYLSPAIPIVYR